MGAPRNTSTTPFPWVGMFVLSALVFTSVTSEFLPTGLLPDIAHELRVSESQVGFLITLFAGTVVITTTPLALVTRRFSRKSLVIVVLLVFVLTNVLAALAPTYELLAAARVGGGLAHGLFWATVGAYSAHLVPRHQIGRAVAITSGGGTAAFVLGVPLGTALGHALGWRIAFAVLGGVILLLIALAVRFLPAVHHGERLATGEIPLPLKRDRTIPGILVVCALIVLVMGAHNIFSTYVAPFLIGPMGAAPADVAPLLFLYGGAGAVGLVVAGIVVDRFPRSAFIVTLGIVSLAVLMLGLMPSNPWLALPAFVVWGAAFGGLPSMMQTRMMHTASLRLRDIAAAAMTTSFNLAIGVGALVGGILLDRVSIRSLPFAYVVLAVVSIVVALVADSWLRRREALRRHP